MGMPISCYWSLVSLARYGERVGGWVKEVRNTFSRFAFVIHDPAMHTEFDSTLNDSFDDLDQMTGARLLFFALVRPQSADIEGLTRRRYFRLFQEAARRSSHVSWEVQQLISPEAIPASPDPSLSAWAFAKALGIEYDALPCIVTTDDLLNSDIEVLRTSPGMLVRQLLDLGKAETRRHRMHTDAHEHGSLFPDEQPERSVARLTRSLASTLAVVLGAAHVSEQGGENGPMCPDVYRDAFVASLHELLMDLRSSRVTLHADTDPPDDLQDLALTIASVLQRLGPRQDPVVPMLSEVLQGDFFDHETRIMLRTGARCLGALTQPPWLSWKLPMHLRALCDVDIAEVDFSPSLMCFAKAFEKEMNLSAVHWVRQRLGISLPEHFNRVQRGVSALYTPTTVPDGRPIDFNASRQGTWIPPGLGSSEIACNELAEKALPAPFTPESWRLLMRHWQNIRSSRNVAAHHGIIDAVQCNEVIASIESLVHQGVFGAASELKRSLRGERTG